jgi:aminoglycoside phosphotransferase (APT) family kinase protein
VSASREGGVDVLDDDIVDALRRCRPTGILSEGEQPWEVAEVRRLSGGASRLTWSVRLDRAEEHVDVIVQQERPGGVGALAMPFQVELLEAARIEGVPVPAVLASGGSPGRCWVVLEHLPGTSLPRHILGGAEYDGIRPLLARRLGKVLASIHRIPVDGIDLPTGDPLAQLRMLSDFLDEPSPAFELGFRWLEESRPRVQGETLVHGDFRMGNILVAPDAVTAVLDWELAHLGDPAEDLGWFCARAWRFGSPDRAGGVGPVEDLLAGYAEGGGEPPDGETLDWWEAFGALKWGLICGLQAATHLRGSHRSVELAAIGRRSSECEEDLLAIIDGPSDEEPPEPPDADVVSGPHVRPSAAELLDAVAEHLGDLRTRMDGSAAFHLRVSTKALEMVSRELRLSPVLDARQRSRLEAVGMRDDRELAEGIRDGSIGVDRPELHRLVRQAVRDKLAVAHPGYWHPDGGRP